MKRSATSTTEKTDAKQPRPASTSTSTTSAAAPAAAHPRHCFGHAASSSSSTASALPNATASSTSGKGSYSVVVRKADFKFNAAHFIAYQDFRERLHGHNYQVGVRIDGSLGRDGYVVDFGNVKTVVRSLCKAINERFICPMASDVLDITIADGVVGIVCQDGSKFSLPENDCVMLPLVHSSVEELAQYLCGKIIDGFTREQLAMRGVRAMEVMVSEAPGQEARYRENL